MRIQQTQKFSEMNALSSSIRAYPIQWAAFFRALVLCGCAFGFKLNGEQIAGLMLVVEAGLTVYTHQNITDTEVENQVAQIQKSN